MREGISKELPVIDRNVFIVSSPLQVLFSISAKHDFGIGVDSAVLIHIETSNPETNAQTRGMINPEDWGRVVRLDKYPPKGLMARFWRPRAEAGALRKFVKEVEAELGGLVGRVAIAFLGDYREALIRHVGSYLRPDKHYLLDDGSVTPQIAMRRHEDPAISSMADQSHFSFKRIKDTAKSAKVNLALQDPKQLVFYSMYDFPVGIADARVSPQHLKKEAQSSDFRVEPVAWIIGNNHVEGGICTFERYFELMKNYSEFFNFSDFFYLPHRREAPQKVDKICSRLGFTQLKAGMPLEVFIMKRKSRPEYILGTASTVLDSIHWLFDGKQKVICIKLSDDYFLGKKKQHIQLIQAYHEEKKHGQFRVFPDNVFHTSSHDEIVRVLELAPGQGV